MYFVSDNVRFSTKKISTDNNRGLRKIRKLSRLWLSLLLGDLRHIGKKNSEKLNARAKMTSDKFDDEPFLVRKTNENKMKNG